MHISSYNKMEKFKNDYLNPHKKLNILELGSMDVNGTYRGLFDELMWTYTGMDIALGKNVDLVVNDPYVWEEVADESYDVVISGSALEHIEFPWLTVTEICRVLKVGGLTCNIAPSAGPQHLHPADCYRYYPDGFNALCKWAGLTPLLIETDWEPKEDPDMGHIWHDTIMIAKKE